jgi:hypothetical protein
LVLPAELKTEAEWEAKQESRNRGGKKGKGAGKWGRLALPAFRQSPVQPGPARQTLMPRILQKVFM